MIARDNRKNKLHLQGGVGLSKGKIPFGSCGLLRHLFFAKFVSDTAGGASYRRNSYPEWTILFASRQLGYLIQDPNPGCEVLMGDSSLKRWESVCQACSSWQNLQPCSLRISKLLNHVHTRRWHKTWTQHQGADGIPQLSPPNLQNVQNWSWEVLHFQVVCCNWRWIHFTKGRRELSNV